MTTTLAEAILARDLGAIRDAVARGDDPNLAFGHPNPDPENFDYDELAPPLVWAARLHLPEGMKLLLEAGANPNGQDSSGKTALSTVVYFVTDWEKLAKKDGVSPHKYRAATIQLLMSHGADPNLTDNTDSNALHLCLGCAAFAGTHYEVATDTRCVEEEAFEWLKELINTGIDQTALDSQGNLPIQKLYLFSGRFMKLLNEAGLRVDIPTKRGNLINTFIDDLEWIDDHDRYTCIEYFLECGIDPNIPNRNGVNIIDYVRDPDLGLLLIKNGAVSTDDSSRETLRYTIEVWNAKSLYEQYNRADEKDKDVLVKAFGHILNAIELDRNDEEVIRLSFDILAELDDADNIIEVMKRFLQDAYEYSGWSVRMEPVGFLNEAMIRRKLNEIFAGARRAANVIYSHKHYDKVLAIYDAAYKARPDTVGGAKFSVFNARQYAYAALNSESKKDLIHLDRVKEEVETFPESAWLRVYYGRLLLLHEEYVVNAELEFRTAIEHDEKVETSARLWLAYAYLKQDLVDDAIEIALEDTKLRSKECSAWGGLGRAYAQAGNYAEAHFAFLRSLKADPNYEWGKRQLDRMGKLLDSR
jgi:tetratricopeptide (TPR) repeat protein